MERIPSQLILAGKPNCSGPLCGKHITDLERAIFLIRNGVTLAYCGSTCYFTACELYLEQRRASREVKGQNFLKSLGYTEDGEESE